MYFKLQRIAVCVFLLVVCAQVSLGSDIESAKRAYHQRDFVTAVKEFTELANSGDSDAQLFLGRMYLIGQGVPKDLDQAMRWFRASAAQGDPDAQFFLGSMLVLPQKDIAEGLKWIRLSAEQGVKDAQLLLGKVYMKGGKELPRDMAQADMWMRLAAKDNKEFYQNELRAAERQMTREQIAKGEALAAAWTPKTRVTPRESGSASAEKD